MRSTLLPPPPPTKSRRSPRSAAANLTPQTTNLSRKKLNFDEFRKRLNFDDAVDESSFLAGFSSSLKFPDDDSWADQGGANPFREAKVAAAAAPGRYKWKEDSRLGRSYRGRYYKSEKKDVPYLFSNKEDESTFCDETTFETNSLTYRDNVSAFTEDDSLTFLTPTPAPSSRRSRHSRRGGHGRFLCGCDDNDRMADTVKDLKGALRDINRSVLQILSPLKNARCYVGNMGKYHPADVRPTRGRSQHVKQRSRSVSVRRDRASSMTRSRRGKSCDPPRVVRL